MAAYVKQTWTDRVSEHPSRRKMENVSGNSFDLIRDEGVIVEEGTPLNAEHFNHMEDGIANAAVPDGNYPNMSVGNATNAENAQVAEQLGTSHDVTVSDGFLYRPTAGNIDVRDDTDENAEIKAIYGKTVIWNQLVQNGNFESTSGWFSSGATQTASGNILSITRTTSSGYGGYREFNMIAGHKYLARIDSKCDVGSSMRSNGLFAHADGTGDWQTSYNMFVSSSSVLYANFHNNQTSNFTPLLLRNFCIFDLTLMFGAGNEPATVEEFRSMFPEPYYPYDAGSLLSFSATGLKTVGFNLLSGDGTAKLIGGKEYRIEGTYTALSFNGAAVTPDDGVFSVYVDGVLTVTGADSTTCVHFRHSGYRDGEYEPYRTETLPLPISTYFPTGMKSVGTVKDELRKDRSVKRLKEMIFDGSQDENWYGFRELTNVCNFAYNITDGKNYSKAVANLFPLNVDYNDDSEHFYVGEDSILIFVSKNKLASLSYTGFRQYLASNNLKIVYELAEPVETPINPPLELTYRAEDFGTEEVLLPEGTEPTSTPMYADISYVQNLRDKLDHLPFSPSVPGDYIVHFDGVKQTYVMDSESSILAQIADRIYEGVDLTVKFAREIEASPYNGNSWAWIKARIQNGNFSGIHVCDWIPFTADSHTYKAQVAGINTYKGYGSPAVGNHIDFISKELWHTSHSVNPVNFNNGTKFGDDRATEIPWRGSDLYLYINSLSGTVASEAVAGGGAGTTVDYSTTGVYDKLPAELKAVIIEKKMILGTRYSETELLTNPTFWYWEKVGKLWLPTECEVYGQGIWVNTGYDMGGSAVQYPIFSGNMNRIKKEGGYNSNWWLLLPSSGDTTDWCMIGFNGSAGSANASIDYYYVPICFRIG